MREKMKIAVISDIHGNYKAYDACMEYLEKHPVDVLFFLGDYITDCPFPQKLLSAFYETLKKRECFWVRGNREEYILNYKKEKQEWKKSSGTGTLLYTAERLKEEDISFFFHCERVLRLESAGMPSTTICHGIPKDIRGNLGEHPELLEEALKQAATPWLFGGHSHKQEIKEGRNGIYLNPGSLGIAIDGVGKRAQFAVVETDGLKYRHEFISIPYDIEGLLKDFEDSGIEEYGKVQVRSVKKTLLTGINYFFHCVSLAVSMSGMSTDRIPEPIWEQAAEKLGIE